MVANIKRYAMRNIKLIDRPMDELTQAECEFMYFHAGTAGSFSIALIEAMLRADHVNLQKLGIGFPEIASVVYRYKNESGYWESLSTKWRAQIKNKEAGLNK